MNKQLQKFARDTIKNGLCHLPVNYQTMFKRMYSHKNMKSSIEQIVDCMPEEKLDWAMEQVDRSLSKLKEEI